MSGVIYASRCHPATIWQKSDMRNVRVTHTLPTHNVIISIYGEELWAKSSRITESMEGITFDAEHLESFAIHIVKTDFISLGNKYEHS